MFLRDLFESHSREVLVILPGRFQPWHKGHAHVFKTVQAMFGDDNCFIATSEKTDQDKSPFEFDEKQEMITATGINKSRVVKVKSPYSAKEIYKHYDPDNTVLIYVVGKEVGRLSTNSYAELPEDLNDAKPMSEQKYQVNIPTHEFTVLGKPITGATELRAMYKTLDDKKAAEFVTDLFGEYKVKVQSILDNKLSRIPKEPMKECIQELNEIIAMYNPRHGTPDKKYSHHKQPVDNQISTKRRDKRWGNVMHKGNKGIFAKAYFKMNELIKTLDNLDPSKEHDAESMNEFLQKLRQVKEIIQDYKAKQREV